MIIETDERAFRVSASRLQAFGRQESCIHSNHQSPHLRTELLSSQTAQSNRAKPHQETAGMYAGEKPPFSSGAVSSSSIDLAPTVLHCESLN